MAPSLTAGTAPQNAGAELDFALGFFRLEPGLVS